MRWEPNGDYARKSGNYSICKVMVRGEWIYELWKVLPEEFISKHSSFEEAKIEAEKK